MNSAEYSRWNGNRDNDRLQGEDQETGADLRKLSLCVPVLFGHVLHAGSSNRRPAIVSFLLQVEFYFSDSNLYRDEFLHGLISSDDEGFVDIATLCVFNRMRQLLNLSSRSATDVDDAAIKTVVESLESSTELKVSEDGKKVKRVRNLVDDPTEVARDIDERSLLVGPFRFDIQLEELQSFFDTVGETNAVRVRRHARSKDFRGSVFVEFKTVEEAARVLKASKKEDGGDGFVFDGAPLVMEEKVAFLNRKKEERRAAGGSERGERSSGAVDDDAGAGHQVGGNSGTITDADIDAYIGSGGMLVKFEFVVPGEDLKGKVTFGLVKDSFGGKEKGLEYVEYVSGELSGCARFSSSEQANAAIAGAEDGKILLAGFSARVGILGGEDEREYVRKMLEAKQRAAAQRAAKDSDGRGKRGRGGRGGRKSGYHKRQRKM
jgi:hypothetical protein